MGYPGKDSDLSPSGSDQGYSGKDSESTSSASERAYSGVHSELQSMNTHPRYSGKDSELLPSGGHQECSGKDIELRCPDAAVLKQPQTQAKTVTKDARAVYSKEKDSKFLLAKPLYQHAVDLKKKPSKAIKSK